jgi:hypothetical protein
MNLFEHTIAAGAASFTVKLSGTAPAPQETGGAGGDAQSANGRQGGEDAGTSGGIPIQVVPGRLDSLKWWVLGILVIAFAGGGYLLSRKTVVVPAGGAAVGANSVPGEKKKGAATGRAGTPKPEAAVEQPTSMAALDQQAGMSLDGLKDLIFKLELRRQAGTISEAEYATERARAEQILRDLVRG